MELGLANKTALVTGGSKGIGLETDRALAREGVKVLICARKESALAEAARDIMRTTQAKIETHPLDVTKVDQIEIIPRIITDKLGRIDILINNAGTGTYKPFLEVTDEELVEGMAINFFAQFRICQRVVPMMIAQGGGRIVNVSGQTGIMTLNPPFLSSCTGPAKSAENGVRPRRSPISLSSPSRTLQVISTVQNSSPTMQWTSPEKKRLNAPALRPPVSCLRPSPRS